ncbi:MAG: chemotaxis protein CheX [Spirochaetia bacterium]|nr:chemotaxis protein CheX [Spirochaetia bacterium]
MTQDELKAFVRGTMNYFNNHGAAPEIGVPFPKNSEFELLDYTGVIGISGARKGAVFITSTTGLFKKMVEQIDPTQASNELALLDMVGEVANTLAGNAQGSFGSDFMISVPAVITGRPKDVHLPVHIPVFIIPFKWQGQQAMLGVGIE